MARPIDPTLTLPDARKDLKMLNAQWENCTDCELGVRRAGYPDLRFVRGEGERRGIMLIGDGPTEMDELNGRPFLGSTGAILRKILKTLGVENAYLTNLTACRSASQQLDGDGQPMFTRSRQRLPVWKDGPLQALHAKACRPRIDEEIYLVDPVVIVMLGQNVAESLLRRKIRMPSAGLSEPERLVIPGASHHALLTDKKQAWFRRQEGRWTAPTAQNEVSYFAIPTIRADWVRRKLADTAPENAFRKLFEDIRAAVRVYEDYLHMVHGSVPAGLGNTTFEAMQNALHVDE